MWARHNLTTDWFYTFDPQGCLSQKIGRDGSVLCSSIYDAQGHEATTDTHPDPFSGYGGQWGYYADWETSGDNGGSCLYLLGHRFYDPNAGRFINRDPIGYDGGIDLYEYADNNPINMVDPDGYTGIYFKGPGWVPSYDDCKEECYERYASDCRLCKRIVNRIRKALCYGAAEVAQANCIADCNRTHFQDWCRHVINNPFPVPAKPKPGPFPIIPPWFPIPAL